MGLALAGPMTGQRNLWLVTNRASGSNDDAALERITSAFAQNGLEIARHSTFPEEPLPTATTANAAGIDLVATFTGDGTLNASLDALESWHGSVLVLAGGTMNLLYHRLFGELTAEQAIAAVADQTAYPRRPRIITSSIGNAYAGILAGPGTSWNNVREALRAGDLLETALETGAAVIETFAGTPVCCSEPPLGRREGYPLLMLEPHDEAIKLVAYHSETPADILEQAAALVQRDFRQGPHEVLGLGHHFTISPTEQAELSVLLDGEPRESDGPVRFSLARCGVDLLATKGHG